ncbi:MAG: CRTAC1 family protein, partial [Gammaproteobacteria bacterium]
RFTDVSVEAGIRVENPATGLPAGKGLAVLVADPNDDGWPDLMVANDTVRNFFFRNSGGHFEEAGAESGLAFDNSGNATGAMGIDGARFTNGSEFAVAIGNFANEMTSFYVAPNRSLLFTDEANIAGIGSGSRGVLSFGLFFFDADLDGRQDLFQANGHVEDDINVVQPSQQHAQSAQLFWNCGDDCRRPFILMPAEEVGDLATPLVGRGAAFADIDGDGDLDVLVTQAGGPARLFENQQATGHHWIRIGLSDESPNSHAIGARLRLHANDMVQERYVTPARSYLSQTELVQTFGLGAGAGEPGLEVTWPNGTVEFFSNLPIDQLVVIKRGSGAPVEK